MWVRWCSTTVGLKCCIVSSRGKCIEEAALLWGQWVHPHCSCSWGRGWTWPMSADKRKAWVSPAMGRLGRGVVVSVPQQPENGLLFPQHFFLMIPADPREQHGALLRGVRWVLGKGSSPQGGWTLAQAEQGSGHSLLELKKHLDMALRNMVWILNAPVWNQELDLVIRAGPFCDSMISYSSVRPLCWALAVCGRNETWM